MVDSAIEWTNKVWNPTLGCERVSSGCGAADEGGCYAERLAFRLAAMGQREYEGLTHRLPNGKVRWTGKVICLPERLKQPLAWTKPVRVFVDSMSDLFHDDVPDEFIAQVFAVMDAARQHTYQVLTKRPKRMAALLQSEPFEEAVCAALDDIAGERGWCYAGSEYWPLPNVWLGVSTEDQRTADERIPLLLQTPAAVRFLSCEPLLGPVRLHSYLWESKQGHVWKGHSSPGHPPWDGCEDCAFWERPRLDGIGWIIAGGESGPKHRPMDIEWPRALRDECIYARVPFHFKQWGGRTHAAGGRLLDGRTWDEYPDVAEVG